MSKALGSSVHITIGRLTEDALCGQVGAHLNAIPHAAVLVVFCDRATKDAKRLAANHNWQTHQGEPLVVVIRERGV